MDHSRLAKEVFDQYASAYEGKFMFLDLYNDTYDTVCNLVVKPHAEIFEIGCGPGNITRYLLSKRSDFKITGIDISPTMIELAKKNNPSAEFNVMDCRDIGQLSKKYDAIVCGFCMPYLSNEECSNLINDAAMLLNENGLFYFSVIEGKYSDSGFEFSSDGKSKTFVYQYEEKYLVDLLAEAGMEITNVIRKSYFKSPEVESTHLIIIARKILK
jgi:predicted TPR repeat methyltransferase